MLVDTHAHLNFEAFRNDWRQVVSRAESAGVGKIIVAGTDLISSKRALELAQEHPAVFASVGIHPHHVRALQESSNSKLQMAKLLGKLRNLAGQPKAAAIGEVGLDNHYYRQSKRYEAENTNDEWQEIKSLQIELLKAQVNLARELNKPLIIHSREAGEEVLDEVNKLQAISNKKVSGVFHCFEGNKQYLNRVLEAGFLVSFTGNITYCEEQAQVAAAVPLDQLLLETDSPFMTPKPYRGKRNEPMHAKIIAERHAKLRGIQFSKVAKITTRNAHLLFRI